MRNMHLKPIHHLCERNRAILAPFADGLGVINEDDPVVMFALVEDLVDVDVAASHDCECFFRCVFVFVGSMSF